MDLTLKRRKAMARRSPHTQPASGELTAFTGVVTERKRNNRLYNDARANQADWDSEELAN